MKRYKLYFLLFINTFAIAQTSTGKIKKESENGLHKIILPVAIRSASNEDLSDLRIYDSKKKEVPYFCKDEVDKVQNFYTDFKIISETLIAKKQTSIVFENPGKSLNNVDLLIANYDGEKNYSISGSNDKNNWYGLTNNNLLTDIISDTDLNISKNIAFPENNYRYLKIEFDDKKTLPISVRKIGNYQSQIISKNWFEINYTKKTTKELIEEKKTQFQITFDRNPFFDKIQFTINEPKLYKRYCMLYKMESRKVKHKFENFKYEIAKFELSSDSKNTFTFPTINEKDFFIEIENLDNQPLKISNIQFFQIPITIYADLKSEENYTIATGNKNLTTPQYDIEFFKNKVSNSLPEATITDVVLPKYNNVKTTKKTFWEQPWIMWFGISVAGLGIVFFASSLLKDLKKTD